MIGLPKRLPPPRNTETCPIDGASANLHKSGSAASQPDREPAFASIKYLGTRPRIIRLAAMRRHRHQATPL